MTGTDATQMQEIAGAIAEALGSADLERYRSLLDPRVTWGPPDDPTWGCRNRDEVLTWYRRARAAGVRGEVVEAAVYGDKVLVGLRVTRPEEDGSPTASERWQVLTVSNGRISDIRGFEDRSSALAGVAS